MGWGDAILGIDGCIYLPPLNAGRTLKYDPHIDETSLVQDHFELNAGERWYTRWALATYRVSHLLYSNQCQPGPRN